MKRRSRIAVAGLTVTTLVAAAAVTASTAQFASAGTANNPGFLVIGQAQLQTGTVTGSYNRLAFYPSGTTNTGTPTSVEGLFNYPKNSCNLSTSSTSASLTGPIGTWGATSSAGAAVPGWAYNAVGVLSPKQSGTNCSQVESSPAEALTLGFNTSPSTGMVSDNFGTAVGFVRASLDIEVKFDAVVRAELIGRDNTVIDTFRLYTGANATAAPDYKNVNCQLKSDSGPDSGANDNCTWSLFAPGILPTDTGSVWDASVLPNGPVVGLRLTAEKGMFDLKGGGDYAQPLLHPTTFDIVGAYQGLLSCDTTDVASVSASGGTTSNVKVVRTLDGSTTTTSTCGDPVPYTLTSDGTSATFRKPTKNALTAQFFVDYTRVLPPPVAYPVPALRIDWLDGAGYRPLAICPPAVFTGLNATTGYADINYGAVIADTNTTDAKTGDLDQSTSMPGTQYACIYGSTQTENGDSSTLTSGDGSLTVVDRVYLTGDPKMG